MEESIPHNRPVKEPDNQTILDAYAVCGECGPKYGAGRPSHISTSTYSQGKCDICLQETGVTEFRDFGWAHSRYGKSATPDLII